MSDPIVHITAGIPDSGTGNITTLGITIPPAGTALASVQGGPVAQGSVTTAAPSYSNGNVNPLSLTTGGALRVDASAATVTVSGTVTANQGGSWSATVTQSTAANLNATVVGTGTFTVQAQQSGTWNINNISGTVSLPTGASTSANQPSNAVIGSTTSGQTGTLIMGAVTTGAPTYTTAQTDPLSLTTAGALRVDGSGATQPVSGTVTANQGGAPWTVKPDGSVWTLTSTSANVNVTNSTLAVTQSGTWTVQQGTPPWLVGGDVASGSSDSGNPVKVGGVARTSNPTAVSNGQRVNGIYDKLGKMITVGAIRDLKGVQKTSITSGSETTVVTAGAAGVFNDVYSFVVTNKSNTSVFVDFKDSTAGTTRMTLAAPANDTRGFTVPVDSAMVQSSAANNWTATVSTGVTSIEITALYVSNL